MYSQEAAELFKHIQSMDLMRQPFRTEKLVELSKAKQGLFALRQWRELRVATSHRGSIELPEEVQN